MGNGVGCILPSCFSTNDSDRAARRQIRFRPARRGRVTSAQHERNRRAVTGANETVTGPRGIGPTLISMFERSSGNCAHGVKRAGVVGRLQFALRGPGRRRRAPARGSGP